MIVPSSSGSSNATNSTPTPTPTPTPPTPTPTPTATPPTATPPTPPSPGQDRPNILMILLDDIGTANIGALRDHWNKKGANMPQTKEVQTPIMDDLINNGVIMEHHYTHAWCTPSRSSLQVGRAPVHIGTQAPFNYFDNHAAGPQEQAASIGIPTNMTGIADVMKKSGYKTHFVGKWDAGIATPRHTPIGRGYQTALHYYSHQTNKWGYYDGINWDREKNRFYDLWVKDEFTDPSKWYGEPARQYTEGNEKCEIRNKIGTIYKDGVLRNNQNCPNDNNQCWNSDFTPTDQKDCTYIESIFEGRVMQVINNHDKTDPLFLMWVPITMHGPKEFPRKAETNKDYTNWGFSTSHQWPGQDGWKFQSNKPEDLGRQAGNMEMRWFDLSLGRVVQTLKDAGLYDNTLIVLTGDNGAANTYMGNPFPFKGQKRSNWEGGIRTPTFVSGGLVPQAVRGSASKRLATIWDWYATFAGLAGVHDITDHEAEAANQKYGLHGKKKLRQPDSFNLWPFITQTDGPSTPKREHVIIGNPGTWYTETTEAVGVLKQEGKYGEVFKLVTGDRKKGANPSSMSKGDRSTAFTPPALADDTADLLCKKEANNGCLYKVGSDYGEKTNLMKANFQAHKGKFSELLSIMEQANGDVFDPEWSKWVETAYKQNGCYGPNGVKKSKDLLCTASNAAAQRAKQMGGFWGPWVDVLPSSSAKSSCLEQHPMHWKKWLNTCAKVKAAGKCGNIRKKKPHLCKCTCV